MQQRVADALKTRSFPYVWHAEFGPSMAQNMGIIRVITKIGVRRGPGTGVCAGLLRNIANMSLHTWVTNHAEVDRVGQTEQAYYGDPLKKMNWDPQGHRNWRKSIWYSLL